MYQLTLGSSYIHSKIFIRNNVLETTIVAQDPCPGFDWKCVHAQSCLALCGLWTVACQASLSMGFSRQEHWNGLLFPPPGDLPDRGLKPTPPALQEDSLLLKIVNVYSWVSALSCWTFPTRLRGSDRIFISGTQRWTFLPKAMLVMELLGFQARQPDSRVHAVPRRLCCFLSSVGKSSP